VKLFKLWLPVVAWAGMIFYFSSIPDLKSGFQYDFLLRKTAHIAEYFVFTFLLYRAFVGSLRMHPWQLLVYPAVFALLYAALDEIHQYFVAGRYCCLSDCLIDAAGIIAWLALIKFQPKIAAKLSKL
jgi:VanZ family protein